MNLSQRFTTNSGEIFIGVFVLLTLILVIFTWFIGV